MIEFNSNDCFIHMWRIWKIVGMFPDENQSHIWLYNIYGFVTNLLASFLSPISVMFNVFYVTNIALIISNLQLSLLFFAGSVKQFIIFTKLPDLRQAKHVFHQLDQRAKANEEEAQYLKRTIKQCRVIVLIIEISFLISILFFACLTFIKRKLIYEGWMKSEWISSNSHYFLVVMLQLLPACFQVFQNIANDLYPSVYLKLLIAHTHVLCMRIGRIGNDKKKTIEESFSELKSCVNDHRNVIRLLEIIKPAISQAVLVQLILTGAVLCIIAFYYVRFDRGVGPLISTIFNMACMLSVSFPVCYFASALMMETERLTTSIFSNSWMDLPLGFKKCIIIFMERSQMTAIFYAGGLITISLQTYISIVRFSFSMFTLLNQMSDDQVIVPANYTII